MTAAGDARFMALALALAGRGLGSVWPNPAVGAVLVRDGRVVGRGSTQPGGRPHAEAVALAQAGDASRGATAYVTLEPCAHRGRAGPCADAIVAAGIARAVVAVPDPDPRTHLAGIARLRAAGVEVEVGLMEREAVTVAGGFFARLGQGRPRVTLKLATTLDGRIATAGGASRWITGPPARRRVHAMRMRHDAVLVGIGTALADDPDLQVRDMGARRQPVRVVLDSRLRLPAASRLARTARQVPVWAVHAEGADASALGALGVRCLAAAGDGTGRLDLSAALGRLADEGLTSVLCEGGGRLGAALVAGGFVDEIAVFSAGRVFGAGGVPAVAGLPDPGVLGSPDYALAGVERVGDDVLHRWLRRNA